MTISATANFFPCIIPLQQQSTLLLNKQLLVFKKFPLASSSSPSNFTILEEEEEEEQQQLNEPQSVSSSTRKEKTRVKKQVPRAGTGPKPVPGQSVTVHCIGFRKNGDLSQKFLSTKDPGQQPFTFKIGQGSVIRVWDEGVLGMQLGEVARLRCSPDYAYGVDGFAAWDNQPNSVLDFEIEVLSIGKKWFWEP